MQRDKGKERICSAKVELFSLVLHRRIKALSRENRNKKDLCHYRVEVEEEREREEREREERVAVCEEKRHSDCPTWFTSFLILAESETPLLLW